LGCGGSAAKWCKDGHEVNFIIMSEGITARDEKRNRQKKSKEINNLKIAAKKSSKIIGIKSLKMMDFPDNRMDSVDFLDIVKVIEKEIKIFKPNTMVTHHKGDLNVDHHLIHKAVITACRPQKKHPVKRILTFEVPSSTEWQTPDPKSAFIPNHFENISKTLNTKLKALKVYKSEMRDWPHPRSLKAIKHLAKWRGSTVGYDSAEAFMLIRNIE